MPDSYSTVRPLTDGKILTIRLLDRRLVEAEHVKRVGEELNAAINAFDKVQVILDFEHVEFMSSAMLSVLITAHAIVLEKEGELVLCNLAKDLAKMLKMMRLNTRIPIHKTLEKAKASFD